MSGTQTAAAPPSEPAPAPAAGAEPAAAERGDPPPGAGAEPGRAGGRAGTGDRERVLTGPLSAEPPGPPAHVAVQDVDDSSVTLSWAAPARPGSAGLDGYVVEHRAHGSRRAHTCARAWGDVCACMGMCVRAHTCVSVHGDVCMCTWGHVCVCPRMGMCVCARMGTCVRVHGCWGRSISGVQSRLPLPPGAGLAGGADRSSPCNPSV